MLIGMSLMAKLGNVIDTESSLLAEFAPKESLDSIIPKLSRDSHAMRRIEAVAQRRRTSHQLIHGDARNAAELKPETVHLVVTSPPY